MQEEDDLKQATADIDAQDKIGSTEEEKKDEPQGEPITSYVKQDMVK
jgi:phage-related minor tail protein